MAQERRPFRFVHTADLHLDSPLVSRALDDPDLRALLDGASRQALTRLVDLCIDEQVDALLIAGDLYDGDRHSAKTAARLSLEMRRLRDADVRVFMIRGNHDATSSLTRSLDLPDNVHVFDGHARPVEIEERSVAVHGISFSQRHVEGSLLPKFKRPVADRWNIGLMHTSVDGSPEHDPYAPCSTAELIGHGFDYWALGHVHKRCVHNDVPAVVMAGIPQGRHINEAGPCSVTLVTLTPDQPARIETRGVRVARFERLEIDIDGLDDRQSVLDRIDSALRDQRDVRPADGLDDHLIVRPRLVGRTPVAFTLIDAPERLLEEVRGLAHRHGSVSIEKIELDVASPSRDASSSPDLLPLDELFADDVITGAAADAFIGEEWERLLKLLPAAHRELLGADEPARRALQRRLLIDGVQRVRARLSSGASDADR